MATWLFIGTVFGFVLLLAAITRRRSTHLVAADQFAEHDEARRRADLVATDAARIADARMPPFHGGSAI